MIYGDLAMLPSRRQCFELLNKHEVPGLVQRHSVVVSNVALYLAQKLKESGLDVNIRLVEGASLLHDIAKIKTLNDKNPLSHCEEGKRIILEEGLDPRLADIIEKHCLPYILDSRLKTWEEKIIYYADKRVNHETIVSLDERFRYLRRRYPQSMDMINRTEPLVQELEKEIFSRVGEKPEIIFRLH
jgi:putative nucleotidyltransferase with HDIG domain